MNKELIQNCIALAESVLQSNADQLDDLQETEAVQTHTVCILFLKEKILLIQLYVIV